MMAYAGPLDGCPRKRLSSISLSSMSNESDRVNTFDVTLLVCLTA